MMVSVTSSRSPPPSTHVRVWASSALGGASRRQVPNGWLGDKHASERQRCARSLARGLLSGRNHHTVGIGRDRRDGHLVAGLRPAAPEHLRAVGQNSAIDWLQHRGGGRPRRREGSLVAADLDDVVLWVSGAPFELAPPASASMPTRVPTATAPPARRPRFTRRCRCRSSSRIANVHLPLSNEMQSCARGQSSAF